MKRFFKGLLLPGLCVPLLALWSCGAKVKRSAVGKYGLPRAIVVLPVANLSQDLRAPVVIRYFLEKELKSKGFILHLKSGEVDRQLRQMGITDARQIDISNIQSIGEFFKVDGILQSALLEYRQEAEESRRAARASFRLVHTQSGTVLWEKEAAAKGRESRRIPLRGTLTTDWTPSLVRSIANGPAGKLPKKIVKEALDRLRP
jgi:hypothetical protein